LCVVGVDPFAVRLLLIRERVSDEGIDVLGFLSQDELTAELLGAQPAEARQLARRYWLLDYPQMADNYRSGGCAPGGTMDEHLATAPWT